MYPVTQRFLDTLARSHTRKSFVEVLHSGIVVARISGDEVIDPDTGTQIMSIGGSVAVDKTAVRRSGVINFLDISGQLLPDEVSDLFAYVNTEIRPWVGVEYWDAKASDVTTVKELVPNGDFETNVNGWVGLNATPTRDTGQFFDGVASMKVTWTTGGALTEAALITPKIDNLIPGSRWIASAMIRCPTGGPRAVLQVGDESTFTIASNTPVADSTWQQLKLPFTVGDNGHISFGVYNLDAATAGQLCNLDLVTITNVDEFISTTEEYVPLATLVVTDVEGSYPQLSVTGYDRMWFLDRFSAAYAIVKGTDYDVAMRDLLASQVPASQLAINIPNTDLNVSAANLLFNEQDSAQDALHSLGTGAGWSVFVDPMGVFTAIDEPSTDDDPVMSYAPGQFSMMMRPRRSIAASQFYNAVVFTGESPANGAAPFRGYAQDDDPNSLTYVGNVGVHVYFESSPLMTSNAQCTLAAKTALLRVLGIPDVITVPIIPNPALDSGDVIQVTDLDQAIDFSLIIDSFPFNMRASDGEQVLTCRAHVIH